jgi:hypothetical protein
MNPQLSFGKEQTVELAHMFRKCGLQSTEWVDIPQWIAFTVAVPTAGGGLLAGQKQSVGSAQGADFYLRRISLLNFTDPTNGPQVFAQIKLPSGRYLQSGNPTNLGLTSVGGTLTPGPLGLVKPEAFCPAGTQFTIDLLNVTSTYKPPGASVTVTIVFVGVYRFRLREVCT